MKGFTLVKNPTNANNVRYLSHISVSVSDMKGFALVQNSTSANIVKKCSLTKATCKIATYLSKTFRI